jgi:hypothetical protein
MLELSIGKRSDWGALHFPNAGRYRMPAKARSANSQIIHTIGVAATPIDLQSARAAWLAIQNDNPVLGVTALSLDFAR